MRIALLSGKGGTGKTFMSVNLASIAGKCTYVDCDVEEPNGDIFIKARYTSRDNVYVKIPLINQEKCINCSKCVASCNFNALANTGNEILLFDKICHSCGLCKLVCPVGAITETNKKIGIVEEGNFHSIRFKRGVLDISNISGVPIIKNLLSDNRLNECLTFIDCPPGSGCSVKECVKYSDYCIIVTEPTLFGVHNLDMIYKLVTTLNKPVGVVINKWADGNNMAHDYCLNRGINILGVIPYDNNIASLNSKGVVISTYGDVYRSRFTTILSSLIREAKYEADFSS